MEDSIDDTSAWRRGRSDAVDVDRDASEDEEMELDTVKGCALYAHESRTKKAEMSVTRRDDDGGSDAAPRRSSHPTMENPHAYI